MHPLYIATHAGLAAAAGLFAGLFVRYRRRLYLERGRNPGWPIPSVLLEEFHQAFVRDELGPTQHAEVVFIGRGDGVPAGTSDREAWILAVLSRGARSMFEFGTCTGRTAYLWARNSSPEATVTTLTLPPEQHTHYAAAPGDDDEAGRDALLESTFTRFRYTGTAVEPKVRQLFGDSKQFDETPYLGQCDLIFVDGSHAYSYVKSDSEKALRMLKPGGIIIWHDYRGRGRHTEGVFLYLNELREELPLVHLDSTSLVAYRRPASAAEGLPAPIAR